MHIYTVLIMFKKMIRTQKYDMDRKGLMSLLYMIHLFLRIYSRSTYDSIYRTRRILLFFAFLLLFLRHELCVSRSSSRAEQSRAEQ